jgi:hypothetical protein
VDAFQVYKQCLHALDNELSTQLSFVLAIMRIPIIFLQALACIIVNATPISQDSLAVDATINSLEPLMVLRDYGDVDETADNDNSGDTAYDSPNINVNTAGGSSVAYTSSPGTYSGCFWQIDGVGKFTSRLHVGNASWTESFFNSSNPGGRYFIRDNSEHLARFRTRQITIAPSGNLHMLSSYVPTSSSSTTSIAAQMITAWPDIQYGSVRTVAKGDMNPGAVYGFFFYNLTKYPYYEADIELQTRLPNGVRFTTQYTGAPESTTNVTLSRGGSIHDWHEYRMDWVPGSISFYVDGVLRLTKTQNLPRSPGAWYWNSWRYEAINQY